MNAGEAATPYAGTFRAAGQLPLLDDDPAVLLDRGHRGAGAARLVERRGDHHVVAGPRAARASQRMPGASMPSSLVIRIATAHRQLSVSIGRRASDPLGEHARSRRTCPVPSPCRVTLSAPAAAPVRTAVAQVAAAGQHGGHARRSSSRRRRGGRPASSRGMLDLVHLAVDQRQAPAARPG